MGLTKEYFRYVPIDKFNIIASNDCNIAFSVLQGQQGRFVAVGACEDVYLWDVRLGEKSLTLLGGKHKVTSLSASPNSNHLAVGFSNGTVNVYELDTSEISTVFTGHRSPISCIAFDENGHRLVSGSMDTDIVVWDMISESGLSRLSGHRGVVTSVCFLKKKNIVISSSKDTFVKLWDLDTGHCFHTIAAHVTEIWGLCIVGDDKYIAVGTGDSEIRIWSLEDANYSNETGDLSGELIVGEVTCKKAGSILRVGRGRTCSMVVDNSGNILCVHGTDSVVEVYNFLGENEATARWKKRLSKEKKKAAKLGVEHVSSKISLKDVIMRMGTIRASDKVKSVAIVQGAAELRIALICSNNKLELYSVPLISDKNEPVLLRQIKNWGHQGDVRAVAFSSDSLAIASVGSSSIKMWNRASLKCLRTVVCDHGVCVCFVPGDRYAVVGNKSGHLLIYDLVSGELSEDIPAHTSELWSVVLLPDKSGILTGGGDQAVKEWKFDLVSEAGKDNKVLSVKHTRTLKLDECVLSVKASPCGMYVAASLLDSTVRIHFLDTFKFFLSLYGHSMPILSLDISFDSKLVITGSADKKIKIWGLDFGDCHKSLFAHDEAVTCVSFVPNSHNFFSTGRDGKIKQWDGDKFERIITFDAHFGEGWCLCVSDNYVVSCGQDRCLRLYSRTDEVLVLEDQQEEERAKEEEEELALDQKSSLVLPSTRTVSSEMASDYLMECLDAIKAYKAESSLNANASLPPMMSALKISKTSDYLIRVLQSIRSSEMDQVLLILPLHLVREMLFSLDELLDNPLYCETAVKSLIFLLKIHLKTLENDTSIIPILDKLEQKAFQTLGSMRDMVGSNLYGLRFIHHDLEEKKGVKLFTDATQKRKEKAKRKLQKQKAKQAVIMTL